ncbi:hypothetical protein GUITHDRAFT_106874 [Guillardia theta CCMP2712]|uniref:Uncharacterized protein n=1 Tax=Guillardia theta (strain CCMP2712) TaxID=905079 RepID=L1JG11_GUITC|nr:hypothetical protein GUITHDRAFT_106874 [Guillardia theta CCMP2712]EKX47431.1 hypothetical protein GUITHDRAFT_106874 [Guillardia theta CCMP2712]|eukprot:XP_005834411.1 hypothetical protein GUITHDRAFT_106874 [Guillardia theta CCMP2712]
MNEVSLQIITGDETGLIKISAPEESAVIAKFGEQKREHAAECMCWSRDASELSFFVGRADGVVKLWDAQASVELANFELGREACTKPRSVFMLRESDSTKLVTVNEEGKVLLQSLDQTLRVTALSIKGPIAYGGQENELQVYDLQTQTVSWKAKNVPENKLRLRLPVWVTDLQYLSSEDENKLVICTAYGQIRLYDIRAQRRPVINASCSPEPDQVRLNAGTRFTCMALSPDESYVVAGDALGGLRKIDLKQGKVCGKFKHIAGSVRAVDFHPSLPLVAAASLDRFVRVYDANTTMMTSRIYAKQRLNCLLFAGEGETKPKKEEESDEDDWLGVEEAKEEKKQKKEEDGDQAKADKQDLIRRKATYVKKRKLPPTKSSKTKKKR